MDRWESGYLASNITVTQNSVLHIFCQTPNFSGYYKEPQHLISTFLIETGFFSIHETDKRRSGVLLQNLVPYHSLWSISH